MAPTACRSGCRRWQRPVRAWPDRHRPSADRPQRVVGGDAVFDVDGEEHRRLTGVASHACRQVSAGPSEHRKSRLLQQPARSSWLLRTARIMRTTVERDSEGSRGACTARSVQLVRLPSPDARSRLHGYPRHTRAKRALSAATSCRDQSRSLVDAGSNGSPTASSSVCSVISLISRRSRCQRAA